jgi:hypothetical protein
MAVRRATRKGQVERWLCGAGKPLASGLRGTRRRVERVAA